MIKAKDYLPREPEEIEYAMERFAWNYFIKTDLRWLHLQHPNKQEVETACLHFLGDDVQAFWEERKEKIQQHLKLFRVIKKIQDLNIEFQVGGSFSLWVNGIIDRSIHDLDIVIGRRIDFGAFSDFPENYEYSEEEVKHDTLSRQLNEIIEGNKFQLSTLEVLCNHRRFTIDDVPVCVFYSPDENYTEYDLFESDQLIKVCDPKYAIEAKKEYLQKFNVKNIEDWELGKKTRYIKHLQDVWDYENWLIKQNIKNG